MNKETYERLAMDVTKFDVEDVITTSGGGTSEHPVSFAPTDMFEMAVGI